MKSRVLVLAAFCAASVYAQGNGNGNGQGNNDGQGGSSVQGQGMPDDAAGGTLMRGVPASNLPPGAHSHGGGGGSVNLIDHGGRILPASKIIYIWWGPSASWPSDAGTGLTDLANGLSGSNFMQDIFPQYMRGAGAPTTVFTAQYSDTSAPPAAAPSTSTIVNEACKVIGAGAVDPTALYVVFTSNFPRSANYCAWHSWGTCGGQEIQVAYMPNTTGVSGCNDPVLSCNSYSQGTQSIANVLSHEFSEAITDANGTAWFDSSGSEIGDKCAWQFSACVNLKNGSSFQLQTEWSNAANLGKGGCVQQ